MKPNLIAPTGAQRVWLAALTGLYLCQSAQAQFSNNSTGALGALSVTQDTELTTPEDGVFNYSTITIEEGATLTFTKNDRNTPIYLLATGDVIINGAIDVSGGTANQTIGGIGGPGGFDGGQPGFNELPPGAGLGPGGGKGGDQSITGAGPGAYLNSGTSTHSNNNQIGENYGSPLLIPLVGGSGGGGSSGSPGNGGGGGGGAVLVSSNTKVTVGATGAIRARGGSDGDGDSFSNQPRHGGSGGAIRIVAPIVDGTGTLDVRAFHANHAGDGRIRIDAVERANMAFTLQPIRSVSVGVLMAVFPSPVPQLHVVEVAGQAIAEGTVPQNTFVLPTGTPAEQIVKVQARDFQGTVNIVVKLIPENGDPIEFPGEIDMSGGNPSTTDVTVTFPLNIGVSVQAWTTEAPQGN